MTEQSFFTTTGTLNDAFFQNNAQYMVSPQFQRNRLIVATIIIGICLAGYAAFQDTQFLILLGVYAVLYVPTTLWYRRSAVKTLIKRTHELCHNGEFTITVSCTETGVRSENHASGGVTVVEYANLATLAVGEGAFILMSQAGQFTVFFTDGMDDEAKGQLLAFLKEKCPKLKIIQ